MYACLMTRTLCLLRCWCCPPLLVPVPLLTMCAWRVSLFRLALVLALLSLLSPLFFTLFIDSPYYPLQTNNCQVFFYILVSRLCVALLLLSHDVLLQR